MRWNYGADVGFLNGNVWLLRRCTDSTRDMVKDDGMEAYAIRRTLRHGRLIEPGGRLVVRIIPVVGTIVAQEDWVLTAARAKETQRYRNSSGIHEIFAVR